MLDNLNWWEIGALLLVALLIFGERLPAVISDGLKMLRNLRNMARNATSDLSRELGTDIRLDDLHPKTFVRKHLLSEEDEAALRRPLQGLYDDVRQDLTGLKSELKDVADATDPRTPASRPAASAKSGAATSGVTGSEAAASGASASGASASGAPRSFDIDAT